jgi:2-polyprenyl-3-methyl-5-hydroxy-6-metoxy-1,4-benzoquinol methylase
MVYRDFAYYYDLLMNDVPYSKWVSFIKGQIQKYEIDGKKLLDLGCGTGAISIPFAKTGFDVTGVDLSADMLALAHEKAIQEKCPIQLIEQDMSKFESGEQYDIIGIFCDSLNYLATEEDVIATFQQAYNHLQEGGLLVFDVHSLYKINEIFNEYTFASNEANFSFIWNCFQGQTPDSVEHELTFFVEDAETETYHRFDECHVQRTFHYATYEKWLKAVGFSDIEITADFTTSRPNDESERIFFSAIKTAIKK